MNPIIALLTGAAGTPGPDASGARHDNPSEVGLFASLLDIAANAPLPGTEGLPADPAFSPGPVGLIEPEAGAVDPATVAAALTPGTLEGEAVVPGSAEPVDIGVEAGITAAPPRIGQTPDASSPNTAEGPETGIDTDPPAGEDPESLPAPAAPAELKLTGLPNALAHARDGADNKGLQTAIVRAGDGPANRDGETSLPRPGGPGGPAVRDPAPAASANPAAPATPAEAGGGRQPATPPLVPPGRTAEAAAAQTSPASPGAPAAAEQSATQGSPSRPQLLHGPVPPARSSYEPAAGQLLLHVHKRGDGEPRVPGGPENGLASVTLRAPAVPQPAAPQPALPGQPPQVPLNALAVHIAQQAQNGTKRFDIRLDPPELGRVEIRLDVTREGHVTTHLVVERSETLDLLQRDARALERALQNAGLDTSEGGLKFSLKDHGQAHDDPGQRDEATATPGTKPDADAGETPRDDDPPVHPRRQYLASAGLDIRI